MFKRIAFDNNRSSFWIERQDDGYVAYKTLRDALKGFVSLKIMLSLGQEGLKAAYNSN